MSQTEQFIKLLKKVLLFSSPLLLLVASYFVFDPFHVLWAYESYPDNYLQSYNRNRISTQVFLNNNDSLKYKSFVFGSSRSSVFYTQDWAKYIKDKNAYHFDASNEEIAGIHGKIKYIAEQGNTLKHALLILDGETFNPSVDHENSIIHIKDWRWSGQNRLLYHLTFFKAFFKDLYFVKYFDIQLNHVFRPYMFGIFENKHMLYTPVNNDFIFQGYIDQIKNDSLAYYSRDLFFERSKEELIAESNIDSLDLQSLHEIKEVFTNHKTNYKIVLGPDYNQNKINPDDLAFINTVFGKENVFDFTGQNELSNKLANYYEIYHYKPVVAREIMAEVYE